MLNPSHAMYIGVQLANAELALKHNLKFTQDQPLKLELEQRYWLHGRFVGNHMNLAICAAEYRSKSDTTLVRTPVTPVEGRSVIRQYL